MGKVRVAKLGDEEEEKKQRKRAEKRREAKKAKKEKVTGVGLKGGERVTVVEGGDVKPEFKDLITKESAEEKVSEKKKPRAQKKARVRSKRYQKLRQMIDPASQYSLVDAVSLVKQTSMTTFDGTVELHLNLNPSSLKAKGDYRGSVNLPHGTGRQIRVAIADDALISEIEGGTINFDVLVAHPSMMRKLARVAKTLGPRGLMPNPKNGTVTDNPEKRAGELAGGEVNFKTEPGQPILHLRVGKVSFDDKKIVDNVNAYLDAVGRPKVLKATLTATMGPGVKVELN
jgi:large subunit ribosomal protein L1